MGHAMRRRMGMPSNHLESAGNKMKKDISQDQYTPSGANATFTNVSGTPSVGKLMPKKNCYQLKNVY
jgi:hypothetical protein